MNREFSPRRFALALGALLTVTGTGTIVFHSITSEGWIGSFYRAVVTVTLTGIDTAPAGPGAKFATIALLLAGVAIFAYVAGAIVELIAHGVLSGAWAERRRRRVIDGLR